MDKPLQKVVAAVIINDDGEILITQRPEDVHLGGYWEFPGGKVEMGEREEDALRRELLEETALEICAVDKFWEDRFEYDIKTVHLVFYICRLCRNNQKVRKVEISDFRWVKKDQLSVFKFPPADTELIEKLKERTVL
jgi:mutator protein MutT